jgi:hypothetical protein
MSTSALSVPGDILKYFDADNRRGVQLTTTPRGSRYALSFTSGSLLMREAAIATPIYLRERDWAEVRQRLEESNLLQARTHASCHRLSREVVQRLTVLTDDELELLVDCTTSERGHLLWAAACRRYELIAEFAEEVLRDHFLLLTPKLTHADFDSFIRRKALWHDELAELKDSTLKKLRSNVFRMLIEAGLLTENYDINEAMISTRVVERLAVQIPSDVRFFPTRVGLS